MLNSKLLVGIQFATIVLIFFPKKSIMISTLWWLPIMIAIVTALWIFTHNKIGNFNVVPEIREDAKLIITGPYRFVRHPMYSTLILFMVGVVLYYFSWINLLLLSIMIAAVALKAYKEEKLWHHHDRCYEAYKKETKMIIPFLL
jgi:protein-S-isoprenylcysteine O-methyltransferase Ste14